MAHIVKRAAAKRDLTLHFVWFAEHAGINVAQRFLEAAERSLLELARMPRMGTLKLPEGKFAGVRMWRVESFGSFLIFYRVLSDGIAIERVFHAGQDYQRVLK